MSCGNGMAVLLLKLLLPAHPALVGKVAVQGKKDVAHLGIDRVMEALDRLGARGYKAKGAVHLAHIRKVERDMPFRQVRVAQTELSAGDAVANGHVFGPQVIEIGARGIGEFIVADAVLQVEPDMVDVHFARPAGSSQKKRETS